MKLAPHDINKLPTDGYLIFPLSMSRLQTGQSPEECYKALEHFDSKITAVGIDGVFLYTNGLYFNNDETALAVRKRTNNQMLEHRNAFLALVEKRKKYIPQAMHFVPWDYIILNSPRYAEYCAKLMKLKDQDPVFSKLVDTGLGAREATEANVSFLIEELVVNHFIRQGLIEFPKTLVKKDAFRLLLYPGMYFKAELYLWKKNILPKNKDYENLYAGTQYNLTEHLLYKFDDLDLPQI
jgi:hypothetical protein